MGTSTELGVLAGRFTGVDRIHESSWASAETATAEAVGSAELDGRLFVQRLDEIRPSGDFQVVNVFLTARDSGEVLLYSFDSLGYPADPPARGRWTGGELVLDRTTERGMSRTTFAPTERGFRWSKDYRPSSDVPWERIVNGELTRYCKSGGGLNR